MRNSAPTLKGADGAGIAVEQWPIDKLVPYSANARAHPPAQIAKLRASIREFGFNVPCLVDKDGVLIAGHGRVMAAKEEGHKSAPVIRLEHLTPAQVRAFRLMDNRVQLDSSWLDDLLVDELAALQGVDFDLSLTGFDDDEIAKLLGKDGAGGAGGPAPKLADKFLIPPFSVLNAREGWWQERKRQWIAIGIQSELGRGGDGRR
jgi:ParB-like chromosome segregation protein Spo0J